MIFGLMVGNVAYAKKVKLFDLSKHELKSKEEGKIETYKIADITLKTDLVYNSKRQYHSNGTKLLLSRNKSFEGMNLIYKRSHNNGPYQNTVRFEFNDEFGEMIKITRTGSDFYVGDKEYRNQSSQNEVLKFSIESNKISVYRNNEFINSIKTEHMDKITNINFTLDKSEEIVYDLKIIAEN